MRTKCCKEFVSVLQSTKCPILGVPEAIASECQGFSRSGGLLIEFEDDLV